MEKPLEIIGMVEEEKKRSIEMEEEPISIIEQLRSIVQCIKQKESGNNQSDWTKVLSCHECDICGYIYSVRLDEPREDCPSCRL